MKQSTPENAKRIIKLLHDTGHDEKYPLALDKPTTLSMIIDTCGTIEYASGNVKKAWEEDGILHIESEDANRKTITATVADTFDEETATRESWLEKDIRTLHETISRSIARIPYIKEDEFDEETRDLVSSIARKLADAEGYISCDITIPDFCIEVCQPTTRVIRSLHIWKDKILVFSEGYADVTEHLIDDFSKETIKTIYKSI